MIQVANGPVVVVAKLLILPSCIHMKGNKVTEK